MIPGPRRALRCAPPFALLLLAAGCPKKAEAPDEKQPPVEVHCVVATRGAVDQKVVLRGRTAPPPGGDLPVAAQVAGRVVETRVKEGDRIGKGTIVAVVDDLGPRAAESQADATLARTRSAEVNARAALERVLALAAKGIASKRDVEDATAREDAAKAEVAASGAALRLAKGTLGRVDVRSTFAGIVTKVWRGSGALVDGTAATPIVELAATESVEFVADVTERDLWLLNEGQPAEITLSTSDVGLVGAVLARSRALDPVTGLGSARIRLDAPAKPDGDGGTAAAVEVRNPPFGAFGKALIAVGRREGVILIPPSALRGAVADGAEIAICKGGKAEIRTVRVGYRDADQVEIAEGLKEGEKVATDHILGLENDTVISEASGGDGEGGHKGDGGTAKEKKGGDDKP